MKIKVKMQGLEKVRRRMVALGRQGRQAFRGAMYAEGLLIIGKATANAPAVTGRLRNSHFATLPNRNGSLVIGFGTKYAAAVEYGLRLINASRRQQKAAFANMREMGWRKSKVGGPGFFRGAIAQTGSGRVARISRRAGRYFKQGIGVMPSTEVPPTPKTG